MYNSTLKKIVLLTSLALFLICLPARGQLSVGLYGDPVINTAGSLFNPDTNHDPLLAIGVKLQYKEPSNKLFLILNYEYTNLAEKYNGLYLGIGFYIDGAEYELWKKFDFILYLDSGLIQRELNLGPGFEHYSDPVSVTGALNGITSYEISEGLSLDFTASLRLRTDIEGKLLGFNGYIGITGEIDTINQAFNQAYNWAKNSIFK